MGACSSTPEDFVRVGLDDPEHERPKRFAIWNRVVVQQHQLKTRKARASNFFEFPEGVTLTDADILMNALQRFEMIKSGEEPGVKPHSPLQINVTDANADADDGYASSQPVYGISPDSKSANAAYPPTTFSDNAPPQTQSILPTYSSESSSQIAPFSSPFAPPRLPSTEMNQYYMSDAPATNDAPYANDEMPSPDTLFVTRSTPLLARGPLPDIGESTSESGLESAQSSPVPVEPSPALHFRVPNQASPAPSPMLSGVPMPLYMTMHEPTLTAVTEADDATDVPAGMPTSADITQAQSANTLLEPLPTPQVETQPSASTAATTIDNTPADHVDDAEAAAEVPELDDVVPDPDDVPSATGSPEFKAQAVFHDEHMDDLDHGADDGVDLDDVMLDDAV